MTTKHARRRRELVGLLAALVVLGAAASGLGVVFALLGCPVGAAGFAGAYALVMLLVLYGAIYRWYARRAWGAPFAVGDRVRLVKGPHRGVAATVVGLQQGTGVEVAYVAEGAACHRNVSWGAIRRIASPPA